jgi:hypothetical protein
MPHDEELQILGSVTAGQQDERLIDWQSVGKHPGGLRSGQQMRHSTELSSMRAGSSRAISEFPYPTGSWDG